MKLHIKNGRIVDPASGKEGAGDVFISDGKISNEGGKADRVIDAKGLVVAPGFIDLSARLREPGYEYKATLSPRWASSPTRAASRSRRRTRRWPTPRCSGARCSTRRPSATRYGCAP